MNSFIRTTFYRLYWAKVAASNKNWRSLPYQTKPSSALQTKKHEALPYQTKYRVASYNSNLISVEPVQAMQQHHNPKKQVPNRILSY